MTKYIFITGGVSSSQGKGIFTSSLGALLKSRGYSVNIVKCDPYLNIDAGTMSPIEHGEVFVTEDGAETDLDLGNYERYLNTSQNTNSNITTGKVYRNVLSMERKGSYQGKTVQIIPHITDEIKRMIILNSKEPKKNPSVKKNSQKNSRGLDVIMKTSVQKDSIITEKSELTNNQNNNIYNRSIYPNGEAIERRKECETNKDIEDKCTQTNFFLIDNEEQEIGDNNYDVILIEIGGTVGDIESQPFLEAERQMIMKMGNENCLALHLSLVPYLPGSGELKTKPSQHSAKELRASGIQPDAIICRSEDKLPDYIKKKISSFTNVQENAVFNCWNAPSVYLVPLMLNSEGVDEFVIRKLHQNISTPQQAGWQWLEGNFKSMHLLPKEKTIKCGVIGKYFSNQDSYKSLFEAVEVAAIHNKRCVKLISLDSENYNQDDLKQCDCIQIPGGFGIRGTEGMIKGIKYARENNVPFFGICLGMQLACVEYARNICNIHEADSQEFNSSATEPVIYLLTEFQDRMGALQIRNKASDLGGTLRQGSYTCIVKKGSLLEKIYGKEIFSERHRHRYEFNNQYKEVLEKAGLVFSGICEQEDNKEMSLCEVVEQKNHRHFIACQYHPEFTGKILQTNPMFDHFVKAAIEYSDLKLDEKPVKRLKI